MKTPKALAKGKTKIVMTNNSSKKPVARKLLLKLLGSRDHIEMNAATAVRVGALFGISENNIRVTLNRLHSSNLLSLVERGYYKLGPEGKQFAAEINQWRHAEALLATWDNSWVAVHTGNLAKSDKKQQRHNARALKLLGMEMLANDLYIRPANLKASPKEIRQKLHNLGLSKHALVFNACDFDTSLNEKAHQLWKGQCLEQRYQEGITKLERCLETLTTLSIEDALIASYEAGDNAIHDLVFDPLLPSPLVNVELRKLYRELVMHFDDVGTQIWYQFLH